MTSFFAIIFISRKHYSINLVKERMKEFKKQHKTHHIRISIFIINSLFKRLSLEYFIELICARLKKTKQTKNNKTCDINHCLGDSNSLYDILFTWV